MNWVTGGLLYAIIGVGVVALLFEAGCYPKPFRRWHCLLYILSAVLWVVVLPLVGLATAIAVCLYMAEQRWHTAHRVKSWKPEDTKPGDTVRILLPDRLEEGRARVIGHNGEFIAVQYFDRGQVRLTNLPAVCVLGPLDGPALPETWHAYRIETTHRAYDEVRRDADVLFLAMRDTLNLIRERKTPITRITVGKVTGFSIDDMYERLDAGRWDPLPGDCYGEDHAHAQEAPSEVPAS